MVHTAISPTEQADRLAIRELLDADAHCGRARGVQWNPADDLRLALELRIERRELRELSGRFVEIEPGRAFAR
jgi:hypothetical protein